jgi:hypothetical protein
MKRKNYLPRGKRVHPTCVRLFLSRGFTHSCCVGQPASQTYQDGRIRSTELAEPVETE